MGTTEKNNWMDVKNNPLPTDKRILVYAHNIDNPGVYIDRYRTIRAKMFHFSKGD